MVAVPISHHTGQTVQTYLNPAFDSSQDLCLIMQLEQQDEHL